MIFVKSVNANKILIKAITNCFFKIFRTRNNIDSNIFEQWYNSRNLPYQKITVCKQSLIGLSKIYVKI